MWPSPSIKAASRAQSIWLTFDRSFPETFLTFPETFRLCMSQVLRRLLRHPALAVIGNRRHDPLGDPLHARGRVLGQGRQDRRGLGDHATRRDLRQTGPKRGGIGGFAFPAFVRLTLAP